MDTDLKPRNSTWLTKADLLFVVSNYEKYQEICIEVVPNTDLSQEFALVDFLRRCIVRNNLSRKRNKSVLEQPCKFSKICWVFVFWFYI